MFWRHCRPVPYVRQTLDVVGYCVMALLMKRQIQCLVPAIEAATCGETDLSCLCAASIDQRDIMECMQSSCTIREQLSTSSLEIGDARNREKWRPRVAPAGQHPNRPANVSGPLTATTNATLTACGISPRTNDPYIPIFITFIVLSGIVVGLRLVARFTMGMKLWWDDWANFGAMVSRRDMRSNRADSGTMGHWN